MRNPPKLSLEQLREIRAHFRRANKIMKEKGFKRAPNGMNVRLAEKYGVSLRAIEHYRTGDRRRKDR